MAGAPEVPDDEESTKTVTSSTRSTRSPATARSPRATSARTSWTTTPPPLDALLQRVDVRLDRGDRVGGVLRDLLHRLLYLLLHRDSGFGLGLFDLDRDGGGGGGRGRQNLCHRALAERGSDEVDVVSRRIGSTATTAGPLTGNSHDPLHAGSMRVHARAKGTSCHGRLLSGEGTRERADC